MVSRLPTLLLSVKLRHAKRTDKTTDWTAGVAPRHLDIPVILEAARPLGKGFECRVRLPDGTLDEAISTEETAALAGALPDADAKVPLANNHSKTERKRP